MQDVDHRQIVAATVRAELARAGRTGADAARALGMSRQAMWPRLAGRRPFRAEEIRALAEWLEVPVSTLLGRDRQPVAS